MPSISTLIQNSLSIQSRKAGEIDFREGRALDVQFDDLFVGGSVRDATDLAKYEVTIEFEYDGRIYGGCECDDFNVAGTCRHVWALARAADVELSKDPSKWSHFREHPALNPFLPAKASQPTPKTREPAWSKKLDEFARRTTYRNAGPHAQQPPVFPMDTEIIYRFDYDTARTWSSSAGITICTRKTNATKPLDFKLLRNGDRWAAAPDSADQVIRNMLLVRGSSFGGDGHYDGHELQLSPEAMPTLIKQICETGRGYAQEVQYGAPVDNPVRMTWDADAPHELEIDATIKGNKVSFVATFRQDQRRVDADSVIFNMGSFLLTKLGRIIQYRAEAGNVINEVLETFPLEVPLADAGKVLRKLASINGMPAINAPPELNVKMEQFTPSPRLLVKRGTQSGNELVASVVFDYGPHPVEAEVSQHAILIAGEEGDTLFKRDIDVETAAFNHLRTLQLRPVSGNLATRFRLAPNRLPQVVRELIQAGWRVEAEGKLFRSAGAFSIKVSSGIDWLEVKGTANFGDKAVSLPAILEAIRKGETTVVLDDGSLGMLPEEWLKRYRLLGAIGEVNDDTVRFKRTQAGILDAMLAELPDVDLDAQFEQARQQLRSFEQVSPADAPAGFVGTLRGYQRQGLGWLRFLNQFNFGGCLADDMGLGKTIQVLALLESRRAQKQGPSLVVAPRSLIFNWQNEAAKFAPQLRVLDHSTTGRRKTIEHLAEYDLVLTTYGALRQDAALLKDFEFDYVILDEAQAIKNAGTASAKAARLLRGRHRLAMTGTPIENHIGELWSLLEFINPGMFGENGSFKVLVDTTDPTGRAAIARAIRPFMLRRTKKQVATDLPDRVEQTLVCELEPRQRKVYDQLHDYYRKSISKSVEEVGIGKSQIAILEALLRLRQAACHPGLIDPKHAKIPSAKIDTLVEQLREATAEGHKVLVFSQFTSLLALVKEALNEAKLTFEYLDGQTRDRQARVDRFQSDPDCSVFLISLKAGGVGLNLTSADYVFLLDPWWNPAVEAQAIDRTHRIGQHRTVMAYRLIAKDTVEEKVLELQRTKRELADAIIGESEQASGAITREDLAVLLA